MKRSLYKIAKENQAFLAFIILMSVFRSAVADWNVVPTGSMQPTIVEGDRIFVNKIAYDVRVPFTHISLMRLSDPVRGDIIVFDSKQSGKRLVKRVIGIPGDVIAMKHNVLTINGRELDYQAVSASHEGTDKIEDLFGLKHLVKTKSRGIGFLSTFNPVSVPDGHYLVLGDNRDNSADSRVIGFIPRSEIVGRSRSVVMSLNYDNYFIPRGDRFFHSLQ